MTKRRSVLTIEKANEIIVKVCTEMPIMKAGLKNEYFPRLELKEGCVVFVIFEEEYSKSQVIDALEYFENTTEVRFREKSTCDKIEVMLRELVSCYSGKVPISEQKERNIDCLLLYPFLLKLSKEIESPSVRVKFVVTNIVLDVIKHQFVFNIVSSCENSECIEIIKEATSTIAEKLLLAQSRKAEEIVLSVIGD